jgi:hypothetical protein
MAALTATHPTILDVQKRLDPDGKISPIIELLTQTNDILTDAVWIEGNLPTGHRTTVRTGLPDPTWRKLYGGVQPTKSRTAQITANCGMLEAYAEVDKALADLNGNTAAWRYGEDQAHILGMNHELASSLIYASESTAPEEITGFAPQFNTVTSVENAENIIREGNAQPDGTDNTSIWLVGWGPQTVHCIYPKGSMAGLKITDKGQVTIENVDGNGGRMEAYRTHYRWDVGLAVRDWRYVVRVQVNSEDLTKAASSGADLIDMLSQASETVPTHEGVNLAWYANKRVRSFLRRQIMNKTVNSTLSMDDVAGRKVMTFDGIPFRRCDAILNTETGIA